MSKEEAPKVLIAMLETKPGSEDGIKVKTFEKDREYRVNPALAKAFVDDMDVAMYVDTEQRRPTSGNTDADPSDEEVPTRNAAKRGDSEDASTDGTSDDAPAMGGSDSGEDDAPALSGW